MKEAFTNFIAVIIALFFAIFLIALRIIEALSIPLFVIFLILKLCGIITWAWIFVFLPLIIFAGAFIILFVIGILKIYSNSNIE